MLLPGWLKQRGHMKCCLIEYTGAPDDLQAIADWLMAAMKRQVNVPCPAR